MVENKNNFNYIIIGLNILLVFSAVRNIGMLVYINSFNITWEYFLIISYFISITLGIFCLFFTKILWTFVVFLHILMASFMGISIIPFHFPGIYHFHVNQYIVLSINCIALIILIILQYLIFLKKSEKIEK
jgi:hypothetical protein